MTEKDKFTEFWGEPISVYTSNQAEEDGILVSTGHPLINYITHTVFERCIEPFIESSIKTKLSLSNNPVNEIIEVGNKAFVINLKISDADKKKSEQELIKKLLDSAIIEIQKLKRQDWMYEIECRGWKLWVCQNETGGYTLMFPEDY